MRRTFWRTGFPPVCRGVGAGIAFTLACLSVSLLAGVSPASAAEVHTRGTPGTWTGNPQTGIMRATIPNDTGWSFWLLAESFDLASGGAIIAQVRYASRVDYGGAGVALMDPAANGSSQRHVRIELSERDDNAGVGGWLGNENTYASGGGRKAGKDIQVGRWYELMLRIDGTRVTGYLDGVEQWSGEVPELRSLPRLVAIAPFVIEADAEIKVTVYPGVRTAPKPPASPAAAAVPAPRVTLEPYGFDETDGSGVGWNRGLPAPSLDDDPNRRGKPNAEWTASYSLRDDAVCVRVDNLRSPFPPAHTLAIGYQVTLDGAAFADGAPSKRIIVHRFSGRPAQTSLETCEKITAAPPRPGHHAW
jgi:hypothetical protein